jgi:hypothetical protein
MARSLLLATCILAFLAPTLIAQATTTVCLFPAKDARGVNTDTPKDVSTLAKELLALPASASFNVVPVTGVSPKEIDAEAAKRSCTDVVTVWRLEQTPDSPNYGGTLGSTQVTTNKDNGLMLKSTLRANGVLLEYSLRKADSHKAIAHGESDDDSAYTNFAAAIAKKVSQGK